jgi:uncharacterized protein
MVCPRVVIDTNIIISALIFGSRVSRLRLAWQDDLFTPLVSKATTTELIRVLAYPKFKLTPTEQEDLLSDYILLYKTWLNLSRFYHSIKISLEGSASVLQPR